jgi:uncharacterized membrane protein
MLSKPTQLWETCYHWLKELGIDVSKSYCRDEISTHPDYPALTSVADFLRNGDMQYYAVKADSSYIQEFNYPILAHVALPGQEYLRIVSSIEDWHKQKDLSKHWSGIVVVPSENPKWLNRDNSSYLRNELKIKLLVSFICFLCLLIFSFTIYYTPDFALNLFGLLSLIGTFTSVLIQVNELGFQSHVVKQLCGVFNESGCDRVINSDYGKGVSGITIADASLIYFSSQFILYVGGCLGNTVLVTSLSTLSLFGLVAALWSLYTQAFKLKSWCALCLIIVFALTSQAVLPYFFRYNSIDLWSLMYFVLPTMILVLLTLPIKQLIKINLANNIKIIELRRFKLDGAAFISKWQQGHLVDEAEESIDLIIGSKDAQLCITAACNLYCKPCARTHQILDDLINRHSNHVCVKLKLLIAGEKSMKAATAVLQKAAEDLPENIRQAVFSTWFENMDLEKWAQMWQPNTKLDVQDSLKQHKLWMHTNQITATPTLFLNNRKIPGQYSLDDIGYLVPQLIEMMPLASRYTSI